jgi:acetyl-CoA C-acetyltransferase
MMNDREVVFVSAARTPIGDFGGSLKDFRATQLAAIAIEEVIRRINLPKDQIEDSIFGCCIQNTDEITVGRIAAQLAGLPDTIPGVTIHRQCTSSMQALVYGAQQILLGEAEILLIGGTESMSNTPFTLKTVRWGARLRHGEMTDALWDALHAGSGILGKPMIMGSTGENLAEKYNLTREQQDEVALTSQHRAVKAIKEGRFKEEIVPVTIPQKKGPPKIFDTDEHPREGLTMEDLARLEPVFKKDGTVTVGNASGINDGACAAILMSRKKAEKLGLEPLAKLRMPGYAVVGVDPRYMGYAPIPATEIALQKAGLTLKDIELIECNEAFAAQYLTCEKLLGWDREIANVNGSGIALGHPVGMSGLRIVITLIYEMRRRGLKKGLATLCGGGGQGMAVILERD